MKKLIICILLAITLLTGCQAKSELYWFEDEKGIYNYCPTIMKDNDKIHVWYCSNRNPYTIIDYIAYRSIDLSKEDAKWTDKAYALTPTEGEWDSLHDCDPTVVKGEFTYKEMEYSYAMFYLGCVNPHCKMNHVGLAFSKSIDGPWVKWKDKPFIAYDGSPEFWGVGQPCAISLDQKGQIALFYTRGDETATGMWVQVIDLTNADEPAIKETVALTTEGLTSIDGSDAILHNGALAYDEEENRYYMVRPRHPFDGLTPGYIASQLQIASIDGDDLLSGKGTWEVIGHVTKEDTDFPRNHNAAILRDAYGYVDAKGGLDVIYTVSKLGDSSLWSYRLKDIHIPVEVEDER